jgi:hypothetical protein
LHPGSVAAIWCCGLLVAVPGAAVAGAAAAVGGGALAICVGSKPPVWRSRRVLVALWLGTCAFSVAAGVLAPPAHVRHGGPTTAGARPAATASGSAANATPATPPHAAATAAPVHSSSPAAAAPTPSSSPAPAAPMPSSSPAAAAPTPSSSPAPAATAAPPHALLTRPADPHAPSAGSDTGPAVAPSTPAAAAAATSVVRTFYAALDAHRFAAAWATLPPSLHASFGGFSHWRAGYRTTLNSRPGQIQVTATADGGLLVRHVLVATDRTRCGTRTQRFAVRWRLAPGRASWGVVSLAATALGPAESACL